MWPADVRRLDLLVLCRLAGRGCATGPGGVPGLVVHLAAAARGSHGIYPIPGPYAVLKSKVKILKEAAGGNRVLVPPDMAGRLDLPADSAAVEIVPYALLDLGLDEATSLSWNRVLIFSGNLVDVPGGTNAGFPPFTAREAEPISYGEEAFLWPVAKIPISARDHIELLKELLNSSR
jgi:hypothetical protein